MATMFFNNAFTDGHTEAGSSRLGREEGFENSLALFGCQTGAIVCDAELPGGTAIKRCRFPCDVDAHGINTRGERVFEDIAKDLFESSCVHGAPRRRAGSGQMERNVAALSRPHQVLPSFLED